MSDNKEEFELPKHDIKEHCVEDYTEEVQDDGSIVQRPIDHNHKVEEPMGEPGHVTEKGKNFSLATLSKQAQVQTYFAEGGRKKTRIRAPKSAWVHNIIHLAGDKFDFTGRDYLHPIYNSNSKHVLLMTGRQVEKSTLLANNLVIMCVLQPFFRCLYVSPSHVQTRTFSNDKLKPVLERSPLIARYLQDNKVSTQVFEKGFTNGAFIFLRSAFFSADRARGISSDLLCIDELQDMVMGNIPVIAQCLSHSKHGYHVYAGTPKSFDNTIQQVWETTSQNEWMVRCTGCRKDNYLDINNIGKHGPICKKCGKDLDVTNGRWMSAKSDSMWQGYRIPQLMVPWIAHKGSDAWKSLVHQMETYPESQFYNEVLGMSFDNAAKPITRADILDCCKDDVKWIRDPLAMSAAEKTYAHKMTLFAGIDWGEGNDGTGTDIMGKIKTASYTILTIGGYVGGKRFRFIFSKRYTGKETDPDYIIKDIMRICMALKVKMIGADWGHGWGMNNKLVREIGPKRFAQFMYVDNQKEVRKWDPVGFKFQLMRNHVMSEMFFMFKDGQMECPNLGLWEHFAQDMLNISVEYIEYQRKLRYVHRPSDPDDWFHSLVYCKQVADIFHGFR
jgi:hypothetical protein